MEFEQEGNEIMRSALYASDGRCVFQGDPIVTAPGTQRFRVDLLSGLATGCYVLELSSATSILRGTVIIANQHAP
ncbi:MAG: hypothetical protein IPK99_10150 [Flavobacteriales bacterium]|nr:hypothetical protein [Flavobacteriales bacterium]